MGMLPQIPNKLQRSTRNFERLRTGNYLYVDKTEYIVNLFNKEPFIFMARPRRFGKSLMVDTIRNLYLGNTALFKGLYIEKYLDDPLFQKHPVINLDLSSIPSTEGLPIIREGLMAQLKSVATNYKIEFSTSSSAVLAFGDLIESISKQEGNVVILIDEYDKLLIDTFDEPQIQNSIRAYFRDFYYQIKSKELFIHLVYITGISKYTKMGVFSAANNIIDFSTEDEFSTMFGYTHEELKVNFYNYVLNTANHLGMQVDAFLDKVQAYYDGYAFSANDSLTVYNPTSIHTFFLKNEFGNYWIKTGQQEFIQKYISQNKFTVADFEYYPITLDQIEMPGEVQQSISPAMYLYQSGYLTPRRDPEKGDYYLTYPNIEVRSSMIDLTEHNFFVALQWQGKRVAAKTELIKCLANDDFVSALSVFNEIFSIIIYDDIDQASGNDLTLECFYRNAIYSLMHYTKLDIRPEEHNGRGRADLVLYYNSKIALFELKISASGTEANVKSKLVEADEQITKYAKSYKDPICMSIVINAKGRHIALASINDDVYKYVPNKKKRLPGTYKRICDLESFLDSMQKSKTKS